MYSVFEVVTCDFQCQSVDWIDVSVLVLRTEYIKEINAVPLLIINQLQTVSPK